jgi:hypothetical protein
VKWRIAKMGLTEKQLNRLILILKSEVRKWDEERESKYNSRFQKENANGRYSEAEFILDQIKEIKKIK